MSSVNKLVADRSQRILLDLVSKPGNDICADCKARAPRWASHNLGIFLCMSCASIHRKIGTHVTKVKSITMDSWSKEQVEVMKSIGNVASNAKYNPNEARHPPPANLEESERDSELEKYIRAKYEFKRFKEIPVPRAPSSSLKPMPPRAQSTPATTGARQPSPVPAMPASHGLTSSKAPEIRPYSASATTTAPSQSQPAAPPRRSIPPSAPPPQHSASPNPTSSNPVWNDIMSLAAPSPSQMPSQSHLQPQQPQFQQSSYASPSFSTNSYGTSSPANPFPSNFLSYSPSRTASLPVPTSAGPSFQVQPAMGNPFGMQQPTGFPGQMAGVPFQPSPSGGIPMQSPFNQPQPSQSPFAHSYTPPSSFPQQQQQQFAPSSFPQQQFVHPSHTPVQQQGYQQQQQPAQGGGNPFAPMQWQQQTGFPGQQPTGFPGQQYGQWGAM